MAKGARSKVKKRFRSLKREQYQIMKGNDELKEMNRKLNLQMNGQDFRVNEPLNGFKYPNLGVIPQIKPQETLDFRSSHIPLAGYQYRGSSRKKNKNGEQVLQTYEEAMNQMDQEDVQQTDVQQENDEILNEQINQQDEIEDDSEDQNKMEVEKKKIQKQKFKKVPAKRSKKTLKF